MARALNIPLALGMLLVVALLAGCSFDWRMEFDNLFPCTWFKADIIFHYIGTVPVKAHPEIEFGVDSEWLENLWEEGDDFYARAYTAPNSPAPEWEEVELEGLQLEDCNLLMLEFWLHIPQDDDLRGVEGSFTATLELVQWNMYDEI